MSNRNKQIRPSSALVVAAALVTVSGAKAEEVTSGAAVAQEPEELEKLVVSATRTAKPRREIGSSVSVITNEEIQRKQATDVGQVLRSVPGVNVSKSGGGPGQFTQIRIRGAEANGTLIRLDGMELNTGGGDEYNIENIPTEIIERIEVIRGAQSVLYGSSATGGVINIITKKGTDDSEVTLSAEGGSFDFHRESVQYRDSVNGYRFNLSFQHAQSNGFSQCNEDRGCSEDDGHEQDNALINVQKQFTDQLNVSAGFRYVDAFVETDSVFQGVMDTDDFADDEERNGFIEVNYSMLDSRLHHTLRGDIVNVDNNFSGTSQSGSEKTALQYDFDYRLTDTYKLVAGLSVEEDDLQSSGRVRENDAYFGQIIADYENLFITGAVRRDEFDSQGFQQETPDETTSRVTVAYFPFEGSDLKLKGNWGEAIVRPTVFELTGGFGIPGNPDLNAEESTSWEIGVEKAFFDGNVNVEVVYFDNEFDEKIISGSPGVPARNANEANSDGFEISASWAPTRRFNTNVNFTLMDSEEIAKDGTVKELRRRPDNFGSLSANYRWSDRLRSNLEVIFQGENTQANFTKPGFSPPREEIDSYTVVNLSGEYDYSERIKMTGRIDNLFDEDYEEVFGFGTAGISGFVGAKFQF